MSTGWNTTGKDIASLLGASQSVQVSAGHLIEGIDASLTDTRSASDPSAGGPGLTWAGGAGGTYDARGRFWLDVGVDGSEADPMWKRFAQLTAVPGYGFRKMRVPKVLHVTSDLDALAVASSAVDVAWTDIDLTATLDASVQDSGDVARVVRRVLLRLYAKITAGAHPTGLKCYLAVREKSVTDPVHYCTTAILAIPNYLDVWVGLDSGENFQYSVDTNAGGNTVEYGIKILGAEEWH